MEAASVAGRIVLRDSTDPDGARLVFSRQAWRDFLDAVRATGFEPA
jgi:hypothetical protein